MSSQNSEVSNVTNKNYNINTNTNDYLSELLKDIYEKIKEIHNLIPFITDLETDRNEEIANLETDRNEEIAKQILVLERFAGYILKKYKKVCKDQVECHKLKLKFQVFKIGFDKLIYNEKCRDTDKKLINDNCINTAKKIRHELEYFLNSQEIFGFGKNFFKRTMREPFTSTKILVGLTMVIPIYGIVIPLILTTATILATVPNIIEYQGKELIIKNTNASKLSDPVDKQSYQQLVTNHKGETEKLLKKLITLFDNSSLLIMVGFAGAFGSIVSIFIRLDQYRHRDSTYKDSLIPILVGFAKPIIGTAFGILIFAMINSNIISIPLLQESRNSTSSSTVNQAENNTVNTKYFFFFTLAFLVGFSERLANDIVKRAEVGLLGEKIENSKQELKEHSDKNKQKIEEHSDKNEQKLEEHTNKLNQNLMNSFDELE